MQGDVEKPDTNVYKLYNSIYKTFSKVQTIKIKSRIVVASAGGQGMKLTRKGHKGTSKDDENLLYLDGGYITVHICRN